MLKPSVSLRIIGTLAVFVAVTAPLYATPSLVLMTPPNYNGVYNIFEGNTLDFTYLFTNDTTTAANVGTVSFSWGLVSGDPTDFISPSFGAIPCFSGPVAANGGTCTFTVQLGTDAPDEGPLFDSLTVTSGGIDTDIGSFSSATTNVYVSDLPEPGTFLLLGSGLASLVGIVRRKVSQ